MKNQYLDSIARTENMSGAGGDFEEGGSYFEGMDESDYAGMDGDNSYADGPAAVRYADPYQISITNAGTVTRTATVFGYSQTFGQTNFGNNTDLTITNLITGTTAGYNQLVSQTITNPFQIGKWRFKSTSDDQLQQTLMLWTSNANGYAQSKPLLLSQLLDGYQQDATILESKRVLTVDANTYFTIPVLAGVKITIMMFPTIIASTKNKILGGNEIGRTVAPRTSAKNTPVTVINTTQGVKGIN